MTRKNIHLRDETIESLSLSDAMASGSLSARITYVTSAYESMVQAHTPGFTENEWMAILDANNGTWFDGPHASMVWANIEDSVGLADKWSCDIHRLSARIQSLPTASQLSVLEVIYRFWSIASDVSSHDALRQSGAVIEGVAE
tara:strand:- start:11876 stop:12304 length:429 start_codon:yes stop_codon:yes gene_type:complete